MQFVVVTVDVCVYVDGLPALLRRAAHDILVQAAGIHWLWHRVVSGISETVGTGGHRTAEHTKRIIKR